MEQKKINTLLVIASVGLIIAGIIFLCIAIFGETKDNLVLTKQIVNGELYNGIYG